MSSLVFVWTVLCGIVLLPPLASATCPYLDRTWGYFCDDQNNFNSTCQCLYPTNNDVNGTSFPVTCQESGQWFPAAAPCVESCELATYMDVELENCVSQDGLPVEPFDCGFDLKCLFPGSSCAVKCSEEGEGEERVPPNPFIGCEWQVSAAGLSSHWNATYAWQSCHAAKEEECEEPFSQLSENNLTVLQITLVVVGVFAVGIALEVGFHFLFHHLLKFHRRASLFLESIRHETFVVGLLAFSLYLVNTSCNLNIRPEVRELLEAIHIFIFMVVLFFHIMWIYLQMYNRAPKPGTTAQKTLKLAAGKLSVFQSHPAAVDHYVKYATVEAIATYMLEHGGYSYLLSSPAIIIMLKSHFGPSTQVVFSVTLLSSFLLYVMCRFGAPFLVKYCPGVCHRAPRPPSTKSAAASKAMPKSTPSLGTPLLGDEESKAGGAAGDHDSHGATAHAHAHAHAHDPSLEHQIEALVEDGKRRRGLGASIAWIIILYVWGASASCAAVVTTLSISAKMPTSTSILTIFDFLASSLLALLSAKYLTHAEMMAGIVDGEALEKAIERGKEDMAKKGATKPGAKKMPAKNGK